MFLSKKYCSFNLTPNQRYLFALVFSSVRQIYYTICCLFYVISYFLSLYDSRQFRVFQYNPIQTARRKIIAPDQDMLSRLDGIENAGIIENAKHIAFTIHLIRKLDGRLIVHVPLHF